MIKNLLKKFETVLYVQIWETKIKVTNISTREVFEEKALVAIRTQDGKQIIEAVGNNASLITDENITIFKPFSHKRLLPSNFTTAEILLQHSFNLLLKKQRVIFRPRVVIHPMEKTDGGLGQIEIRAFRELAISAGARNVKVHQGKELSILNFEYEALPNDYDL